MNKKTYVLFLSVIFFNCISLIGQDTFLSTKLSKVWEVNSRLAVPESAFYNRFDNTIYVSNIVGQFNVKDGIGYISKISPNGKMIQKEWIKGLNAPKGMCFTRSRLFITDFDRVLEIKMPSGKILKEYKNSLSKDLNDITITTDGKVYVTDSGSDCLFVVGKDSLEVFIQSPDVKGMNGINNDGNLIYIGAGGKLLSIDTMTKSISILAENVGYLDGLIKINESTFITSDWGGKIQLIVLGKAPEKLLESKTHAADLGYIASRHLLLIPTFTENKLIAYRLKIDE
jgi:hypothetical protein